MGEPQSRRLWRRLRRWLIFLPIGYLIVLGVMLAFENRLVYFPSGPSEWIDPGSLRHDDLTLTAADGTSIHAWWCPKDGADGALIFCHGNGGNLSMRADEYAQLRDALNVGVLAFDFPGYGRSGGKPTEAGCYAAARAASDWLTGRGIPPERVVLFGESLGGGVAAELATRRPCRALVLYSTFTSAPDVGQALYPLLPVRLLMRNRFDTLARLPSIRCPVFIAHGDADEMIPHSHARRLFAAAAEPKELLIDPGRRHVLELSPSFLKALREFLAKHAP